MCCSSGNILNVCFFFKFPFPFCQVVSTLMCSFLVILLHNDQLCSSSVPWTPVTVIILDRQLKCHICVIWPVDISNFRNYCTVKKKNLLHSTNILGISLSIRMSIWFSIMYPYFCLYNYIQTEQIQLSATLNSSHPSRPTMPPSFGPPSSLLPHSHGLSEVDLADPLRSILSHRTPVGQKTCPPLDLISSCLSVMLSELLLKFGPHRLLS